MWEIWTLGHEKAEISDIKARKKPQNEAKNCPISLWDADAAGSSPVSPAANVALRPVKKREKESL